MADVDIDYSLEAATRSSSHFDIAVDAAERTRYIYYHDEPRGARPRRGRRATRTPMFGCLSCFAYIYSHDHTEEDVNLPRPYDDGAAFGARDFKDVETPRRDAPRHDDAARKMRFQDGLMGADEREGRIGYYFMQAAILSLRQCRCAGMPMAMSRCKVITMSATEASVTIFRRAGLEALHARHACATGSSLSAFLLMVSIAEHIYL